MRLWTKLLKNVVKRCRKIKIAKIANASKSDSEAKMEFTAAWAKGDSDAVMKMAHYQIRCSKCSSTYKMSNGVRQFQSASLQEEKKTKRGC